MFKIIFLGTPDFAVPSLQALINDERFEVVSVITQPDKPVGRHSELVSPPVKICAEKHGIPVHQPEKLKSDTGYRIPEADCFVVVAFGKILPQWFLDIPKHGVVNVHGSVLPRWRGASPIQAAIAAGDKKTGVTIMKMDALLDHGPILATKEIEIQDHDTGGTLRDKLSELGADTLPNALADFLNGRIEPVEQNHDLATTCKTLKRKEGKIDWNKSAEEIERLVRAYDPWPGTWFEFDGKRLKILRARVCANQNLKPGQRFLQNQMPCVACANDSALGLVTVQPEGRPKMSGSDFLRGCSSWQ
ncbi:MAG: methionyl-tRNA formyltransferase [Patescibacteria group bacterium]|nr:methionyl-tRNA formyltransferase [Patescibacteria group bacterium]MBU2508848.1 methionyl-tRNA formyltransferase [Patescibacteria group bacterium]